MLYFAEVSFVMRKITREMVKTGKKKIFSYEPCRYSDWGKAEDLAQAEALEREYVETTLEYFPEKITDFLTHGQVTKIMPWVGDYYLSVDIADLQCLKIKVREVTAEEALQHFAITEILEEYPKLGCSFLKKG